MRVEEMGRDDTASPDKVASKIFSRARQNVSDMLRGESSREEDPERDGSRRSRAVQIRDHFNKGAFWSRPVFVELIFIRFSDD